MERPCLMQSLCKKSFLKAKFWFHMLASSRFKTSPGSISAKKLFFLLSLFLNSFKKCSTCSSTDGPASGSQSHRLIGSSKLTVGVNVRVAACLSLRVAQR